MPRIKTLPQIIRGKNGSQVYKIAAGEQKTLIILLGGAGNLEQNIAVELEGSGATANILGIIIGGATGKYILNTLQKHTAPHTTSNLLVKGVFWGNSKLQYRGLIKIAKTAQNADAIQREDNLVFSKAITIDTRPELEIEANEVRCTHAATIGQVDSKQLYYLMTRGIKKARAEKLLIESFLEEVMEQIVDQNTQNKLRREINRLLQLIPKT